MLQIIKTEVVTIYYFINEEHKNNFEHLLAHYNLRSNGDFQFVPSIYIASVPEIFYLLPSKENLDSTSPLFALTEWSEDEEEHVFVHSGLTSTTQQMCEFGLSLFNGRLIGLDEVFGSVKSEEYVRALIQAIRMRTRVYI